MNQKLLQQLALAKQAGTQGMAKDFFTKTPGPGQDAGADGEPKPGGDMQTSAAPGDVTTAGPTNDEAGAGGAMPGGDQMTPEQLQELLQLLEQQGGQGGGQG